jgi:hypothetical protein
MKLRKRWVEEGACGWVIWRRNFFGFKNVHEIWGHYYWHGSGVSRMTAVTSRRLVLSV